MPPKKTTSGYSTVPNNIKKKKKKYSNITTQYKLNAQDPQMQNFIKPNGNFHIKLVENDDTQGVRKAKNFTLQITALFTLENATETPLPIEYALVYTPSLQTSLNLQTPTTNPNVLYPVSKSVIQSGFVNNGQTIVIKSPLARKLNAGDYIELILQNTTTKKITNINFITTLNYAIAFN